MKIPAAGVASRQASTIMKTRRTAWDPACVASATPPMLGAATSTHAIATATAFLPLECRLGLRAGSRAGRGGRAGRDIGGKTGQVRAGPRHERRADPQVELVLGQPALHERGLERIDRLLAV